MKRKQNYAHAERLVRLVVDALLAAGAFDPYWLDLPLPQCEFSSRDFLRDGVVPEWIAELVEEKLSEYCFDAVLTAERLALERERLAREGNR